MEKGTFCAHTHERTHEQGKMNYTKKKFNEMYSKKMKKEKCEEKVKQIKWIPQLEFVQTCCIFSFVCFCSFRSFHLGSNDDVQRKLNEASILAHFSLIFSF